MTPAEKKDANRIVLAARKKIEGNPDLERDMLAEWEKVQNKIEAHIAASKKRWKVYEAHHVTATARFTMLAAFVDGKSPEECADAALEHVGITAA